MGIRIHEEVVIGFRPTGAGVTSQEGTQTTSTYLNVASVGYKGFKAELLLRNDANRLCRAGPRRGCSRSSATMLLFGADPDAADYDGRIGRTTRWRNGDARVRENGKSGWRRTARENKREADVRSETLRGAQSGSTGGRERSREEEPAGGAGEGARGLELGGGGSGVLGRRNGDSGMGSPRRGRRKLKGLCAGGERSMQDCSRRGNGGQGRRAGMQGRCNGRCPGKILERSVQGGGRLKMLSRHVETKIRGSGLAKIHKLRREERERATRTRFLKPGAAKLEEALKIVAGTNEGSIHCCSRDYRSCFDIAETSTSF
ncbi:hypothetical protein KFL_000050010 [Klebsormidium nitens]|uniref:Uncharacterized protein n=1 Tax=Klebsormidium nitens TaxID=105231 RepID=A0A1Y1HHD3_KLENI|nr:hypothetical protein KFL_000050010 [Klebsormidium nitens]|eukprot:GAQ77864.1 hypothetical protein KFL_000050010 [Klebsormidium nitens]